MMTSHLRAYAAQPWSVLAVHLLHRHGRGPFRLQSTPHHELQRRHEEAHGWGSRLAQPSSKTRSSTSKT